MKLKDIAEGTTYFRKLVLELSKELPFLTFRKHDENPYNLRAEGFIEHNGEPHPYRVDVHYGPRHPMMFLTAEFARGDSHFKKKLDSAIKAVGLPEPETSTTELGFYTASFNFVR